VPGIFKRGGSFVVVFRTGDGRQHKMAAPTISAAKRLKASLVTDVDRGEFRERSHVRFADYAPAWCRMYAGRTSRGFREGTRASYLRGLGFDEDGKPLDRAAVYFGRMKLAEIEPRHVKGYLQSLADAGLAPSSIRRLFAPLRAMLQDATEEGVLRFDAASGVRVPASAKAPEPKRKDLEPDDLERLRGELGRDEDRLLVDFLVATGVRVSEVIALDWSDADFGRRRVSISKRDYRGDVDRPKSAMSRRDVRISQRMAQRLWELRKSREQATDEDPIFTTRTGKRHNYGNLYHRLLKPAMLAAGIEHGGFHRLRHSCGTQLRRRGASLEEIQLHLGHEDLAFTRRTYVHLDERDGPDPELLDDLAGCAAASPSSPTRLEAVAGQLVKVR
jgi:integrase